MPEESEHSYCSVGLIEPSTVPPKPSQSLTTAYTEVPPRTANTQPKARPYQLRGRTVPNQARCGRPKCPGRQTRLCHALRLRPASPHPKSQIRAIRRLHDTLSEAWSPVCLPRSYRSDPQPGQPKFATESNSTYAILPETLAPHLGSSLGLRPHDGNAGGNRTRFCCFRCST